MFPQLVEEMGVEASGVQDLVMGLVALQGKSICKLGCRESGEACSSCCGWVGGLYVGLQGSGRLV